MKKRKRMQQVIVDNILEKVELEDYQTKLMAEKWINQLEYANTRAGRNCWDYYFTQVIILLSSVTIPILANIKQDTEIIKWLITGLGLATSIAAGINQLFKMERKWIHYRVISEKLRIEGFAFLGLSSNYSEFKSHKEAFAYFSSNIDVIMTQDLNQYKELLLIDRNDNGKPTE